MTKLTDNASFIIRSPDDLPPDPPYAHQFYEAIGRFVITWGTMETHLDALMRMAINIDARTSPEKQFLVPLRRKLDQLKKLCRDVPSLKQFHPASQRLSVIAKNWGQDRDFLIHSTFIGFDDGPPSHIILRHLEHPKGTIIRSEIGKFNLDQINAFSSQVISLDREIVRLIADVVPLQDEKKLREAQLQGQSADSKKTPIPL